MRDRGVTWAGGQGHYVRKQLPTSPSITLEAPKTQAVKNKQGPESFGCLITYT